LAEISRNLSEVSLAGISASLARRAVSFAMRRSKEALSTIPASHWDEVAILNLCYAEFLSWRP
jgi:hypothetical protein